jgi:hypothetical protein
METDMNTETLKPGEDLERYAPPSLEVLGNVATFTQKVSGDEDNDDYMPS